MSGYASRKRLVDHMTAATAPAAVCGLVVSEISVVEATRDRILAEMAKVRDANGLDDEDPPNVVRGKTAVLALVDVLEHAAKAGAAGVEHQLDLAFEIGRLFGIVTAARGLSPGGSRMTVEDLAADFGSGAYRATCQVHASGMTGRR